MAVLGEIKAASVLHVTGSCAVFTILLCYSLAVSYHHVPVWLPMISDCALQSPEKYPFRFGILTSGLLMALVNVMIYLAFSPRSLLAACLGVLASLCLGVVGVVSEDEATRVHGTLAVTFFVLYWINMVILTGLSSRVLLPCYNRKAPLCLWHILKLAVRQVTTCIAGVALVMAAVVSSSHWDKHQTYLAVCEWSGTFAILAFNWSYTGDFGSIRLAELQTHSQEQKPSSHDHEEFEAEKLKLTCT